MIRRIHLLNPLLGFSMPYSGHHSMAICGASCQDNYDYCMTKDIVKVTCKRCLALARHPEEERLQ